MKYANVAVQGDSYKQNRIMMEMVRQKVFLLFDLPFILVTGRDRLGKSIDLEFLIRNLEAYQDDYVLLATMWGQNHQMLRPIGTALRKIAELELEVMKGERSSQESMHNFSIDVENRAFVLSLAMEITMSLGVTGE